MTRITFLSATISSFCISFCVTCVHLRSEVGINFLGVFLSVSGLIYSLISFSRRRQIKRAGEDLDFFIKLNLTDRKNIDIQRQNLVNRLDDGIVEGLVLSGLGSIVPPIFLYFIK